MPMRALRFAVALGIVALSLACGQEVPPNPVPPRPAATLPSVRETQRTAATTSIRDEAIDPATGVPTSCGFSKVVAHPDPSVLLHEFLRRDSSGQFLQTDSWFDGATECPGHEGAPDHFELIAGYDVSALVVGSDVATGTVLYRALGTVFAGLPFDPNPRIITQQFRLRKTMFGWRLTGTLLNQRVMLTAPTAARYLKPDELSRASAAAAALK
jgi:hypothetical protein